jgi:hypothetical protein
MANRDSSGKELSDEGGWPIDGVSTKFNFEIIANILQHSRDRLISSLICSHFATALAVILQMALTDDFLAADHALHKEC